MTASPAQRYAAFRRTQAGPQLSAFEVGYPFGLDDFQRRACRAVERGRGVLVAAPTGAGKTVVGEFAVHLALEAGHKCFYTTPIKALSNQKYAELRARYGADRVGLLTGDTTVRGDAEVVVMTTEVLRNMLYADSPALRGLSHVVMDEVHYLADHARGAVWEEVIIHLPREVVLVSLSATVSNAEEFAEWLVTVRGDTEVVVAEHRPVPLTQQVLIGDRMHDLFSNGQQVNPVLVRSAQRENARASTGKTGSGRNGGRGRQRPGLTRPQVLERLEREGLLPAITFVFSRAGCQQAVAQCLHSGLRLLDHAGAEAVREYVQRRTSDLAPADLGVLGYWDFLEGLQRGIAAHHAGMLPTFKEIVEELFARGLVKAVFATETLALGVNMPARSVVLEKLTKWNGQQHADITAGEFTQLTGRAGRRGIDTQGHAIVLWQPGMDPRSTAGLASTRTYPLRSSFRPSYNMAVNLVDASGREAARALLESSFAQFQADRSVVGLARQLSTSLEALDGYQASMACHLGDAEGYARLRAEITQRERELAEQGSAHRRAAAAAALETLTVGDVVAVPHGKRSGPVIVLDPGLRGSGEAHPLVLTTDRWAGRLSSADFPYPVEVLDRVRVPPEFNPRSAPERRELAAALRARQVRLLRPPRKRSGAADDELLGRLRVALRRHPVHGCDQRETHLRWGERYRRLRAETDALERRIASKTNSIAHTFDRVVAVLEAKDYLRGEQVTETGSQLARIYSESDLLVVECLRAGVWDALTAAELAAALSSLVFQARRADDISRPPPGGAVQVALRQMRRTWQQVSAAEARQRLSVTRAPEDGFAWTAWRWADGADLNQVLRADPDLSAGDFVRCCSQLIDLLGQVAQVAAMTDSPVAPTARQALRALRRGVLVDPVAGPHPPTGRQGAESGGDAR